MIDNGIVLLVEDNEEILVANKQVLERDGYTIITAKTLREARELLKTTTPDVVVLDIMLPDGDGVDFLSEMRESCSAPVLFLTGKKKPEEKLTGLLAGGNDYITKPYDIRELRARVRNFMALKSNIQNSTTTITLGPLKLDIVAQHAFLNDTDMLLSPKEFALFLLFAQNEDRTMSAETIYEKIWNAPMGSDVNAVRTTTSRLRSKLASSGYTITSRRNVGYCFEKE